MTTQVPETPAQDLMAELAVLRSQVETLTRAQPKIVRAPRQTPRYERTYETPEALRAKGMRSIQKGQEVSGASLYLDTPEGRQKVPPEYRPVFYPGDRVLLNLEVVPHGDHRTWGQITSGLRSFTGEGEVLGTALITKTWEPKYKVHFPGLTQPSGSGFRESELLPNDD